MPIEDEKSPQRGLMREYVRMAEEKRTSAAAVAAATRTAATAKQRENQDACRCRDDKCDYSGN